MTTIVHDDNGPFVRAARESTLDGQTETVYAVRAEYKTGEPEFWNVGSTPHTDEDLADMRNWIYRQRKGRTIVSIEPVSRAVTIAAGDWTEVV